MTADPATDATSEQVDRRLAAAAWAPTLGPFIAFGRAWTVRTDDPDLAALLGDLLADLEGETPQGGQAARFTVLAPSPGRVGAVLRDDERLGSAYGHASVLGTLLFGINRWVLGAADDPDVLILHAGGVARADGTAVVLPGASEAGKSTLTAGLLARGHAYLSDEAVRLDPGRSVTGYRKPLSIDPGAFEALRHLRPERPPAQATYLERQWQLRGSAVSSLATRPRLGAVVFPTFEDGTPTRLTPLGPAEVLVRAAACTFGPPGEPPLELAQVEALAERLAGVPGYDLRTGDLTTACDVVSTVITAAGTPA